MGQEAEIRGAIQRESQPCVLMDWMLGWGENCQSGGTIEWSREPGARSRIGGKGDVRSLRGIYEDVQGKTPSGQVNGWAWRSGVTFRMQVGKLATQEIT